MLAAASPRLLLVLHEIAVDVDEDRVRTVAGVSHARRHGPERPAGQMERVVGLRGAREGEGGIARLGSGGVREPAAGGAGSDRPVGGRDQVGDDEGRAGRQLERSPDSPVGGVDAESVDLPGAADPYRETRPLALPPRWVLLWTDWALAGAAATAAARAARARVAVRIGILLGVVGRRSLERRKRTERATDREGVPLPRLFHGLEQLRLRRGPKRASRPPRREVALHAAEQRAVARRDAQRRRVERLLAAVRERERARRRGRTRARRTPPPPPRSRRGSGRAGRRTCPPRAGSARAVEGGAQPRVPDRLALVGPAAVVMEARARRARSGGGPGGACAHFPPSTGSGSQAPSAPTRNTPTRS